MGDYESYREAAAAILATQSGRPAVDTFGLADVFADGDLSPAYAFLEAQGYRGAVTPALAMLGAARADVLLAAPCASVAAVPGWYDGASVLVGDQSRSDLAPLARGGAHADDYLTLFDVDAGTAGEHADAIARLRVGAAAELLGVCDRLLRWRTHGRDGSSGSRSPTSKRSNICWHGQQPNGTSSVACSTSRYAGYPSPCWRRR